MKTVLLRFVFLLLWFMSAVLMFVACSPNEGPAPGWTPDDYLGSNTPGSLPPMEFATAAVPSTQMPSILADTVTPPANPMAPEDLSAYPTFVGTLQILAADAFNNLNGRYFCGIQLQSPIELWKMFATIYLLDKESKELIHFDHPLLQSCVVGDTVLVTGTPMLISDGIALGVEMYFVQPLHP